VSSCDGEGRGKVGDCGVLGGGLGDGVIGNDLDMVNDNLILT